jgi:hypothetical protein
MLDRKHGGRLVGAWRGASGEIEGEDDDDFGTRRRADEWDGRLLCSLFVAGPRYRRRRAIHRVVSILSRTLLHCNRPKFFSGALRSTLRSGDVLGDQNIMVNGGFVAGV